MTASEAAGGVDPGHGPGFGDPMGQRARHPTGGLAGLLTQFHVAHDQIGPGPQHRRVALPGLGELLHPPAQLLPPRRVGTHRAQRLVERTHHLAGLGHQGAEQVLHVGEVQVEGAVRCPGHLDDVVDARRVVAAAVEHGHGRIEQLAHGLAALAAQRPLAGRFARHHRRARCPRPGPGCRLRPRTTPDGPGPAGTVAARSAWSHDAPDRSRGGPVNPDPARLCQPGPRRDLSARTPPRSVSPDPGRARRPP